MRFEEALKSMRDGKKVVYREEIYWIDTEDDPQKIVRYEFDDDEGYLDTSTIHEARLSGAELLSENWSVLDDTLTKQIFDEEQDDRG